MINCMEKLILGAPNRGIPIGNLTSQLLANAYLNELDQFVKRKLRVKHYIRYMDDFVLLATSHEEALSLRDQIKTFLEEKLRLVLSPQKVHIGRCIEGITFVGYRIHPDKIRFRGQSLRRMRKKLYKARVADLATFECKAQSIYSGVLMAYKGQVKYVTNSNTVWRQLTEINFGQLSPKSLAEF
jgi:RNA-directed DNA polymerase